MQFKISNPIHFPLSEEQVLPANAIWSGLSACVDAGPGTGKSHTMRAIVKNYAGNVQSIPFGRALADEEIACYADFGHVTSLNFHRRGIRLCGKASVAANKLQALANEMEGMEDDEGEEINRVSLAEFTGKLKVEGVGTYDDALKPEEIATKYGFKACLVPHGIKLLALSDAQTNVIDFDDMLRFPVLQHRTDWVTGLAALDEVQDYTPHAFEFLTKCLVKKGTQILMIGDVDQTLQGFAGATPALIQIMADYYGCTQFQLTVNRRCAQSIVRNAPRMSKVMQALPDAPEGTVGVKSQTEVFDAVAAGEYKTDAIISEANAPLVMFGLSLLIKGVPVQMRTARLEKLVYRYCPFALLDQRKVALGQVAGLVRKRLAEEAAESGEVSDEGRDVADAIESLESYCIAKGILKPQWVRNGRSVRPKHPIFQALDILCSGKVGITLLTGHTAKGLEWDTVFHLPGKMKAPEQDWQVHQAACLDYVIKTRARLNHFTLDTPESDESVREGVQNRGIDAESEALEWESCHS